MSHPLYNRADGTDANTDRPKRRNTRPGTPPFLKDPREARPNEMIGGGYFVFRRGKDTGRIRAPEFPFEHPTYGDAYAEARRLAALHPGETFEVLSTMHRFRSVDGEVRSTPDPNGAAA